MANYAYLQKLRPKLRVETFRPILAKAVLDLLGERWRVALAPFEDEGPAFLVTIPGTAEASWRAFTTVPFNPAEAEDLGWMVAIQSGGAVLAFRHGPLTDLERWAQGCIEEELSERLKAPLHYDAGPITFKAGQRREYRKGRTLREYLLRNFNGVARDAKHAEYLEQIERGRRRGSSTAGAREASCSRGSSGFRVRCGCPQGR